MHPAYTQPGRITIDITLPLRPEPSASPEEPLHVLVAAHAQQIERAAQELEVLADAGWHIEEVRTDPARRHLENEVGYYASAQVDDLLEGLAALESIGLTVSHVQYATDTGHYEVDTDRLDDAEPTA